MDLIDFGGASWSARELAAGRISNENFYSILRSRFRILNLTIFLAPIWIIFSPPEGEIVSLLLFYPALWNKTNYIQQFLITKNDIDFAVRLQISERLIWLTSIPLILLQANKYATFVIPVIFGLVIHSVFGTLRVSKLCKKTNKKPSQISIYKKSKHFGINSVLSDIANLDTFIISKFISIAEAGSYALVTRMRNPLHMIFQSIATRQRPIFARRIKDEIHETFMEDIKIGIFGIFLNIAFAIFMFNFSSVIFGQEYLGIGLIMLLGILAQVPNNLNVVMISFLAAVGEEIYVSKLYTFFTPTTLIIIAVSSFYSGIIYVCWSVLFINLIIMLNCMYRTKKAYLNL